MRRLLGLLFISSSLLLGAAPAHAESPGQIDHVEVADNGNVKLLFSLPESAAGAAPDLDTVRVTVGGKQVDAQASAIESGDVKRTAVLALDVSASMTGVRFDAAKQAALAYLEAAPADLAVGLVTFAGAVEVPQAPTTDHEAVAQAVDGLHLSSGTRLYDGILRATEELGTAGQRQIMVLSDGADTGGTPLEHVVHKAESAGVTVDVVALEQSPEDQAKLRQITDTTGGSVLAADDPAALRSLFTRQAETLAHQILVTFGSPHTGETTVAVALDADGLTYSDSTFVALTAVSSPASKSGSAPIPVPPQSTWVDEQMMLVGVCALGLGLAVVAGLLLAGKPKDRQSRIQQQLAFYTPGASTGVSPGAHVAARPQVDLRGSAVAVADQIVKNGGLEARLTQRLNAAGLSFTAAEWLLLHAGIVVVGGFAGLLLTGNAIGALLFVLGGAVGPWLFLSMKESRRLKAFNSQLADTLQLMAGGLSAGLSLPQSVDTVVREGAEPMAGELRRSLIEQRLGVDIEDALEGVAERMHSKDFAWVVMAIRIQREIGGNLAELLNTVASTIREREYLRRQVRSLSAEGRLSAWILGGLPPVFAAYLSVSQPGYLAPMYSTSLGIMLTIGAVAMLGIGSFWLKTVVKVEV